MGKSYPLSFSGAHWEESHPEFKLTYPETLSHDTGIDIGELGAVMRDQGVWRELNHRYSIHRCGRRMMMSARAMHNTKFFAQAPKNLCSDLCPCMRAGQGTMSGPTIES